MRLYRRETDIPLRDDSEDDDAPKEVDGAFHFPRREASRPPWPSASQPLYGGPFHFPFTVFDPSTTIPLAKLLKFVTGKYRNYLVSLKLEPISRGVQFCRPAYLYHENPKIFRWVLGWLTLCYRVPWIRILYFSVVIVRYLGLYLDKRLSWNPHTRLKRKDLNRLYRLLDHRSQVTSNNKLFIYKTIRKPIWTYGLEI